MKHSILRCRAVTQRTGLARSTLYAKVAEGSFPKPIALGPRAVGWLEEEIDNWLAERIEQSRKGTG